MSVFYILINHQKDLSTKTIVIHSSTIIERVSPQKPFGGFYLKFLLSKDLTLKQFTRYYSILLQVSSIKKGRPKRGSWGVC